MVPMKMRSLFRIYISVAGGQGVWGCGNDFSDSQVWGLRNLLGLGLQGSRFLVQRFQV